MRIKIVNVMVGVLVSLVFCLSVCSAADVKMAPNGTAVNIAPLKAVLTGAAAGATLTVPSFSGTALGKEIVGTAKVTAEGETTLDGVAVTKATTRIDLTVSGTDYGSSVRTEYFRQDNGELFRMVEQNRVLTPLTAAPLPNDLVHIGDTGPLATFKDLAGTTIVLTWAIKGSSKGGAIVEIIGTVTSPTGAQLGTEVTSYYLNAAGLPKDLTVQVNGARGEATFMGTIKTQKLGAGG